jgi:hypothetical protein
MQINDRVIVSTGLWQQWIDTLPTPKYPKDRDELTNMSWHTHIFRIARLTVIPHPETKEAIVGCQLRSESGGVSKTVPMNCLVKYPEDSSH